VTPYDRLMAEEIPVRPTPPPAPGPPRSWTPEEQAQHQADLLTAINGWHWQDDPRVSTRRRGHLRLIETNTEAA